MKKKKIKICADIYKNLQNDLTVTFIMTYANYQP